MNRTNLHFRAVPLALLSTALFLSCRKDTSEPPANGDPTPAAASWSKLVIGNTWTYAIVQFDSLDNEVPTTWTDVVTVTGDSVVNGTTWSVVQGTRDIHNPGQTSGYTHLLRDSADCIVALGGACVFRANAPGASLFASVIPPSGTLTWSMADAPASVVVPAGTFTTAVVEGEAEYPGLPVRTLRTHRADGIGLVQDETKYLFSGGGYRKKLSAYSVQ
ncbi:MAG TPA: hypothetical protein PKE21_05605 [Flavobacteriales bacterium]|nr:hypothetical protein [Flavobacteriales bacterium]HMR26935.1 hypothetical protein [Flavobacteriales bacterium]